MELLLVSVIAVITAAAVFSGIGILEKQLSDYQLEVRGDLGKSDFQNQMQMDFVNAKSAYLSNGQLKLNLATKQIAYQFNPESVLRYRMDSETKGIEMDYSLSRLIGYWQGAIVEDGLIDGLRLVGKNENDLTNYFVHRDLSSMQKMAIADGD